MTVLTAQNVSVQLQNKNVLNDVDLLIEPGELIGLIGPNGAGKSTLLRSLCGLINVNSGDVLLDDKQLQNVDRRELAKVVSYLPQTGQSHWSISVKSFVSLGRLPHRGPWSGLSSKDENAINRAMEIMDVAQFSSRKTTELSGGEFSRAMLARVWAGEPQILLADEPVSDLDPYHMLEVMEHLKVLTNQGAAVVVVLHDLTLAARFCSHLVLLRGGCVVKNGSPEEVLTADYLADVYRINIISGNHAGAPYIIPWERINQAV